jgi:hypothetical protein
MTDYRRNPVPGGNFFFTVNLLDRRYDLLVRHIDALREAVRRARLRAPFNIHAWSFFPITCIACGPCREAMPTSRSECPPPIWRNALCCSALRLANPVSKATTATSPNRRHPGATVITIGQSWRRSSRV